MRLLMFLLPALVPPAYVALLYVEKRLIGTHHVGFLGYPLWLVAAGAGAWLLARDHAMPVFSRLVIAVGFFVAALVVSALATWFLQCTWLGAGCH